MQEGQDKTTLIRYFLSFFVPVRRKAEKSVDVSKKRIVAIIPTYKPETTTYNLVKQLILWNRNIRVIVVDDCTPEDASKRTITDIKKLARRSKRVTYLRTPLNKLKAGALNYGIAHAASFAKKPHVIVTFDDDVIVNRFTIRHLVQALYGIKGRGVVCSLSHVANKNHNLLTRLQALEYHGFNVVKLADNGFLKGPLVMQGMLSAFRYSAIEAVAGFSVGHLIEDYDITARLKNAGWSAGLAHKADAWTEVPTSLSALWLQRVRWSFGGLHVVKNFHRTIQAVFQDLVGHFIFVILLALIILSFILARTGDVDSRMIAFLVIFALIQFVIAFIFQALTLLSYKDADRYDWLLRLSFLPEFLYSNVLSFVLLGSYIFFVYTTFSKRIAQRFTSFSSIDRIALKLFAKLGYSMTWGTRANS